MYIYIYILYTCIYIYIHICVYTHIHKYIQILYVIPRYIKLVYPAIATHWDVRHVCMYLYTCMYICTYVKSIHDPCAVHTRPTLLPHVHCMCVYVYACTYNLCTLVHICVYIDTSLMTSSRTQTQRHSHRRFPKFNGLFK